MLPKSMTVLSIDEREKRGMEEEKKGVRKREGEEEHKRERMPARVPCLVYQYFL